MENNVKKVIVTHRDIRDVVVSRYHRIVRFPKKPNDDFYMDYNKITKEEGINHSIKVVTSEYKEWIVGWLKISNDIPGFVHFRKFEDLINNRKEEFKKMLDFYEIQISNTLIDNIILETVGKNSVEKNFKQSSALPWAFASILDLVKLESGKKSLQKKT